jgi:hypothetical protein
MTVNASTAHKPRIVLIEYDSCSLTLRCVTAGPRSTIASQILAVLADRGAHDDVPKLG